MDIYRRSLRKDGLCVEALVVPPLGNNVYVVYEDGSDSCLIIDVAQGSDAILRRLKELEVRPKTIVNTHGHTDHTAEDEELRKATGAKLAIHELDAYRLATEDEASRELRIEKRPIEADIQLVDGQVLSVGSGVELQVLHTPGHTEGSICLFDQRRNQLFSGDTLFAGGYGRTDGSGADPSALVSSLKRLMGLPHETDVYPGHGSFTTIGDETWLREMVGED
ncbi:MAG: MBL fold metallo-hydrolase [Thaumarchaeota archaeon]|nr:MBL fold metallo-hydrolase [Nitrososphaerota archaeon]MCL5068366.1 MBL fold metallo-hydrolase [Nitrososphaerota archaeon]MDG6907457.1 MBL fold metallo-hydrolase [Nitrososphaerota archaeon]